MRAQRLAEGGAAKIPAHSRARQKRLRGEAK